MGGRRFNVAISLPLFSRNAHHAARPVNGVGPATPARRPSKRTDLHCRRACERARACRRPRKGPFLRRTVCRGRRDDRRIAPRRLLSVERTTAESSWFPPNLMYPGTDCSAVTSSRAVGKRDTRQWGAMRHPCRHRPDRVVPPEPPTMSAQIVRPAIEGPNRNPFRHAPHPFCGRSS